MLLAFEVPEKRVSHVTVASEPEEPLELRKNCQQRGERLSLLEADPLVPLAPSLLRPSRPSHVSVVSVADATKLLKTEKMLVLRCLKLFGAT